MAFHSKKDFAGLCGIKSKDLSVYIQRKKVFPTGDLIDDANEINQAFMQRMSAKKGAVVSEPSAGPEPVRKGKKKPPANPLTGLLKERGELEVLQRRNILKLQQIEIEKKRGEVIPTQAVKSLIVYHSESIKTAYTEASDNLIVIIAQQKQLSATEIANIRKEFLAIVNKAVDKAVDATKQNLSNIVKDYKVKRGVGDHD